MSLPLVLGCLWVVASAFVAFLPMRRQYAPGLALLIAAPVLIVLLGVYHGPWMALAALAGFLSMFRNPVIYLARKALGLPVSPLPTDKDQAR